MIKFKYIILLNSCFLTFGVFGYDLGARNEQSKIQQNASAAIIFNKRMEGFKRRNDSFVNLFKDECQKSFSSSRLTTLLSIMSEYKDKIAKDVIEEFEKHPNYPIEEQLYAYVNVNLNIMERIVSERNMSEKIYLMNYMIDIPCARFKLMCLAVDT